MKYCYSINGSCSCFDSPMAGQKVCFQGLGASGGSISGSGADFAQSIVDSGAAFVTDNFSVFATVATVFVVSKAFRGR